MNGARVRIQANELGLGTVEVNGQDVSNMVGGVDIVVRAGRVTRVALYLVPAAVEFEAPAALEVLGLEQDGAKNG